MATRANGASLTIATLDVGLIRDISGPGISFDTIDITNHDSSGWREFMPGLGDGGQVTFTVVWDKTDAGQIGLTGILAESPPTEKACVLTQSDGASWTFDAVLDGITANNPVDGEISADISLKVSGAVTYAAGA